MKYVSANFLSLATLPTLIIWKLTNIIENYRHLKQIIIFPELSSSWETIFTQMVHWNEFLLKKM